MPKHHYAQTDFPNMPMKPPTLEDIEKAYCYGLWVGGFEECTHEGRMVADLAYECTRLRGREISIKQIVQEKDDKIDALRTELAAMRMTLEDWIKIANSGANKLNMKVRECDRLRSALEAYVNADDWTKSIEDKALSALSPTQTP